MRRAVVAALVLALGGCRTASSAAEPEAKTMAPSSTAGVALLHHPYCSGVAPRQEDYAKLTHPLANTPFVVLRGDHNSAAAPVASFTTGSDGTFVVPRLGPGTYCVVRAAAQLSAEKEAEILALPPATPMDPQRRGTWTDEACLKRLPLKCDAVWQTDLPYFRAQVDIANGYCSWSRPCVHSDVGPPP